jgi:flavin reductase (DIM6/NTAB) family NADH-FMN oxidoreductase RutF
MKEVSIKKAFEKFKPESCVFVISWDKKNKRPSGMIAGWNMKCSAKPPLFAVSLWKKGYTHKLIRQSREFVIAVPNKKLEKAVKFFGTRHGDKVDKFKKTKIETLPSRYLKSPLIKEATINLECKLKKEVDSGDHIIFIGEVLAAYINPNKKVLLNMKKVAGKRIFKEF